MASLSEVVTEAKAASSIDESVLESLIRFCKGNDEAKVFVVSELENTVVNVLHTSDDNRLRLHAAKLLRVVTCCKESRLSEASCHFIVKSLENSSALPLRVALCAIIWNLSVSDRHRTFLINNMVLTALANQLSCKHLLLQREAAGAIRNFSIDRNLHEEFSRTNVLLPLCKAISHSNIDHLVAERLLSCFTCISTNKVTRFHMCTKGVIKPLIRFVETPPTDEFETTFLCALSTLVNLSIDDKSGILNKFFTPTIANQLSRSDLPNVKEAADAILDNIEDNTSHSGHKKKFSLSETENYEEFPEKEATPQGEAQDLLRKLNLEESVRWQDISLTRKIGEGQYGDVWEGRYHSYPVAVKVIKREMVTHEATKALDEISLMAKLKHPNVVLLMGTCLNDQDQIMIVTEYATRGDLRKALLSPELRSLSQRLKIGLDMASGLHWLASHGVVHRDLKLPNLLVFDDWTVKVGDFGLSLQLKEGQLVHKFGGNVKYSAPEILRIRYNDMSGPYPYSEKTDVYSYSLMLWEVVTLKPLFIRPREYEGKKGLAKFVLDGHRPELDKTWPTSLKNLLASCWHADPSERPSFQDIIRQWPELTTDVLCPDKYGRDLVKKLWIKGTEEAPIPFEEFKKAFGEICMGEGALTLFSKKNQFYCKLLSTILCETSFDDAVSKKRFCNLVGWFGPIDRDNACQGFFSRLKDLLSQKFFHGYLSSKKATNQLQTSYDQKRQQYYLVRFSEVEVGGFYLTFTEDDGKISHERICNRKGKWFVENLMEEFDSWKKVVSNCKGVWNIKKVLPGSPYLQVQKKGFI